MSAAGNLQASSGANVGPRASKTPSPLGFPPNIATTSATGVGDGSSSATAVRSCGDSSPHATRTSIPNDAPTSNDWRATSDRTRVIAPPLRELRCRAPVVI